jgi:hypothetical protein
MVMASFLAIKLHLSNMPETKVGLGGAVDCQFFIPTLVGPRVHCSVQSVLSLWSPFLKGHELLSETVRVGRQALFYVLRVLQWILIAVYGGHEFYPSLKVLEMDTQSD